MNDEAFDSRTPPHDIGAEQATLGAALLSPEAAAQVAEIVARDDFYRVQHQTIYDAIIAMRAAGTPVDAESLRLELTRRKAWTGGFDPLYLHTLMAACPAPVNAATYARTVAEHAGRRRAIETLARGLQQLHQPDADLPDVLADTATALAIETELATDGGGRGEPELILLDDFLATDDEPVLYRVDGLWPVGGRVVLAAQFKAGKTTLRDNLVRALVDKEEFLDRFTVTPPDGRVVIIDNELDSRMLRRWLREQGIVNTNRVAVLSLRGRVGTFDLRDPATRARWAKRLRDINASVVVFDCLRPVLDALGLAEDKEAGRFLVAFDALLDEADASEAVLIHHMGHQGERSRGDSRLVDWPDVTWRLVREKSDDGETHPDARRFFSAYGRDVDVPEGLLEFDRDRRRLVLTGGSRAETAADAALPDMLDYLKGNPGASGRAIENALTPGYKRAEIRIALARAITAGRIDVAHGPRRSVMHFVADPESSAPAILKNSAHSQWSSNVPAAQPSAPSAPTQIGLDDESNSPVRQPARRTETPAHNASAPSAPQVRQRTGRECASAPPYRGGGALAHTTHPDPSCEGCGNRLDPAFVSESDLCTICAVKENHRDRPA